LLIFYIFVEPFIQNHIPYVTIRISAGITEIQYYNNEITNFDRWARHTFNGVGAFFGPFGAIIPMAYELGKTSGPSTWFK